VVEEEVELASCVGMPVTKDSEGRDGPPVKTELSNVELNPAARVVKLPSVADVTMLLSLVVSKLKVELKT